MTRQSFAHAARLEIVEDQVGIGAAAVSGDLRRDIAVVEMIADAGPFLDGLRRHEAVAAACVGAVAQSLEDRDAAGDYAAHLAVGRLHDRKEAGLVGAGRHEEAEASRAPAPTSMPRRSIIACFPRFAVHSDFVLYFLAAPWRVFPPETASESRLILPIFLLKSGCICINATLIARP
jgi:hypothetical protein